MENARKIFDALVNGDEGAAQKHFNTAISDKLEMSMDIKRVAVTADIFNKSVDESVELEEALNAKDFLKGGNTKISDSDVDDLLGKIYDNSTLAKALVRNKVYQDGEDNPKKKNTYKKGTADFHLFQLGQQSELTRS